MAYTFTPTVPVLEAETEGRQPGPQSKFYSSLDYKETDKKPGVAQAFDPSTRGRQRQADLCES